MFVVGPVPGHVVPKHPSAHPYTATPSDGYALAKYEFPLAPEYEIP